MQRTTKGDRRPGAGLSLAVIVVTALGLALLLQHRVLKTTACHRREMWALESLPLSEI